MNVAPTTAPVAAERCSPNDVVILKRFMDAVTQEPQADEMFRQWGWVLGNHIAFSELWEDPSPAVAELDAIREGAVASRDITLEMGPLAATWPRYAKDAYMGQWPETTTPILVLHGGLDPATLLRKARTGKDRYTRPGQHWIEVPTATHTVIASSTTSEKRSCGTMMMMSFFENPAAPDTSCLAKVLPLDFASASATGAQVFGTSELWE